MNEEKVYVILEKDLSSGVSNIYGIYKNKEKAKRLDLKSRSKPMGL